MLYVLAIYESPEAFDARTGEDQEAYMGCLAGLCRSPAGMPA